MRSCDRVLSVAAFDRALSAAVVRRRACSNNEIVIMASASNQGLLTQRGQEMKEHNGFAYVKEKLSADQTRQFWRCRYVGSCRARLHTRVSSGAFVKVVGVHSDDQDPAAIAVAKKRTQLKKRALETQETPLQLIESVFAATSEAERLIMPNSDVLARQANRARNIGGRPRTIPSNRAEIEIPEEFGQYESEPGRWEEFLIGDTGKNSIFRESFDQDEVIGLTLKHSTDSRVLRFRIWRSEANPPLWASISTKLDQCLYEGLSRRYIQFDAAVVCTDSCHSCRTRRFCSSHLLRSVAG